MMTSIPSKYPVLENRPIDQWKVTELKKELKRRRLKTGGLKADLIKRLDEDLRAEATSVEANGSNGAGDAKHVNVIHDTATNVSEEPTLQTSYCETIAFENAKDITGLNDATKKREGIADSNNVLLEVDVKDCEEHLSKYEIVKGQQIGLGKDPLHGVGIVTTADVDVASEILSYGSREGFLSEKTMAENMFLDGKPEYSDNITPACVDVKLESSAQKNQASEVSSSLGLPVKSVNSVSFDLISLVEKNDLEDKLVTNNVKLESYVKPEMVEPSSSGLVPDDCESHEDKASVEETINTVVNANMSQEICSVHLGSEKLNLDRSSGDDSMEEDALERNGIDSSYTYEDVGEQTKENEVTPVKTETPVTITMDIDLPAELEILHDPKNDLASLSDKRKLSDEVLNKKPAKRQHLWKTESNNVPLNDRKVPLSQKSATSSLRIDHFLRPFTLKAVLELLGKTGTVVDFWMDQIKTHCYVTYTSVEEAVKTRNTVYNLQWPPICGRQLVAEFVDPSEVKLRLVDGLDPPLPPLFEKIDAPILILDDLFKKTKATPNIYYLPSSDKQVVAQRNKIKQRRI